MHHKPKNTRIILPNAPERPVTINAGMRMRAWYDILSLDKGDVEEDEAGILDSTRALTQLLDVESSKIGADKIILGGFSQGGAMSIQTGLQYKKKLAGIMSCSGYLLMSHAYPQQVSEANKNTPVFAYHGKDDPMVSVRFARLSYDKLKQSGVRVEYTEEPHLEHSLSEAELSKMKKFWTEKLFGAKAKL
jgi:predicted esterase